MLIPRDPEQRINDYSKGRKMKKKKKRRRRRRKIVKIPGRTKKNESIKWPYWMSTQAVIGNGGEQVVLFTDFTPSSFLRRGVCPRALSWDLPSKISRCPLQLRILYGRWVTSLPRVTVEKNGVLGLLSVSVQLLVTWSFSSRYTGSSKAVPVYRTEGFRTGIPYRGVPYRVNTGTVAVVFQ